MTMFMVHRCCRHDQSHCESSPGSFDKCRQRRVAANPQNKPVNLGCESGMCLVRDLTQPLWRTSYNVVNYQ